MTLRTLLLLLAVLPATGFAQQHPHHSSPVSRTTPPAVATPAPVAVVVSITGYASAFVGYKPFRGDEPAADWRHANEAMAQLGGHVGQLRGEAPKAKASSATHSHGMEKGQ